MDYLGDLPTLVADRQKLFQLEGVDAAVSYSSSGKRNLEILRSGETDFALMALTPLVLDTLADPSPGGPDDPVILASVGYSTQLNRVVARAGDAARDPSGLRGRRIGLVRGTNAEFVWWLFAEYHGFDPVSATLVDLPVEALSDALDEGEIDAAVIWEPWASRIRNSIAEPLHAFPGSNVYTAKWVIVAPRRIAARNPELVRAVLAAYRAAIEFIDRDRSAAARLYADHAGLTPDMLSGALDNTIYELSLDWSLVATLQQQLAWARRAGYAPTTSLPAVLPFIDAAPLRDVSSDAVGVPEAFDSMRQRSQ